MTTDVLPDNKSRASTFAYSSGFGIKPTMFRKDSGILVLERVAVFRSGTFRDSMGIQNTWEKIHIKQMIDNFNHLRGNGTFDDVPVRDGHPGWLIHGLPGNGKVVGWHTNLKSEEIEAPHDGSKYEYLLADYEITDPEAQTNIENGTWRNRSAEIGSYLTNNEAEFYPVYMGVAYVDIPAVEGLKFQSPTGAKFFMLDSMSSKEISVGTEPTQTTPAQNAPVLPFQDAKPQAFAINGQQVTDPVAIQAHISGLERFRSETMEQNRRDFVTGLATAGKIMAPQTEALTAFALGLTPEQFTSWCATWDSAAKAPVLETHVDGVTNSGNDAETGMTAEQEQHSIWRDTILAHKMAGASVDKIKATASYKSLIAAGQTVDL